MSSVVVAALLFTLAGCSSNSVSESQCLAGDWQTIGYRDGANGYRSTQLLNHQNACVKHGVIPDRASYMAGWEQGVREYCEANNGYDVGERGEGYDNVCPDDMRDAFLAAYHSGRELYLARSEVSDLESGHQPSASIGSTRSRRNSFRALRSSSTRRCCRPPE